MIWLPLSIIKKRSITAMSNIQSGTLHFTSPEGVTTVYRGANPGPEATLIVSSWDVARRAILRGDIALGEDYVEGRWETDNVENLFSLFLINLDQFESFAHGSALSRLMFFITNSILRRNSKLGSSRNIQAHYDVGNDFYRLWLDETMTYSSGIYDDQTQSLGDAQIQKYARILQKFPSTGKLLEIGCGWGGFAEQAARQNLDVTGLTISPAQHAFATKRLQSSNADIRLQDYRDTKESFDMIVSIEMFEAVGERYWPQYFETIRNCLRKNGKAVIQTITIRDDCFDEYRLRSDFIRHYVFPGGMLPSVKRFREEAAKAGLKCMEVFSFGNDYARTLREWTKRFDARRDEILALGYSEAFIRNWRFYLGICAAAFAVGRTNVVQVELKHA